MLISIVTDTTFFSPDPLPPSFAGFVYAQAGLRLCFSHALNKVDSVLSLRINGKCTTFTLPIP